MMPVLFCTIYAGFPFYFGDKPERVLVKVDEETYTDYRKTYRCNPHVLVFPYTGGQNASLTEHSLQMQ